MKKFSIEILCDESYMTDSLRELANNIENSEVLNGEYADENGVTEVSGDHYSAEIKEIEI